MILEDTEISVLHAIRPDGPDPEALRAAEPPYAPLAMPDQTLQHPRPARPAIAWTFLRPSSLRT